MAGTATDTLEVFAPIPREVAVAGRTITVLPLKMRQLPGFARAAEPFMALIVTSDYMGAITAHGPSVCEAVAIATGTDRDWLDELYPDDMVRLAAAVFEVNLDFFAHRLLPVTREMGAGMAARMLEWSGAPPSPDSSAADTASPNALI
ncbi:hypothetical protein RNZ50_15655 [Paracoccaceae bacterium Fryx2]|nr:hypothetical protein [Paracoccaceae bacterium Fryx2]